MQRYLQFLITAHYIFGLNYLSRKKVIVGCANGAPSDHRRFSQHIFEKKRIS